MRKIHKEKLPEEITILCFVEKSNDTYIEKVQSQGVWVYYFESITNWMMKRFDTIKDAVVTACMIKDAMVMKNGKQIKLKKYGGHTVEVTDDTGVTRVLQL